MILWRGYDFGRVKYLTEAFLKYKDVFKSLTASKKFEEACGASRQWRVVCHMNKTVLTTFKMI